jgi:uncharacterized protein (TIGR03067 family)
MRFVFPPLVVVFAILAAPAAGQDKKPKEKLDKEAAKAVAAELKALVGNWRVTKATVDGEDATEHLKVLTFQIRDGGRYTARLGMQTDPGTFTVDPAKEPKEMNLKPTGGPQKGKNVKAIYKLDGNTLVVCYDHKTPENAPAKFESPAGGTLLLITYSRDKKK